MSSNKTIAKNTLMIYILISMLVGLYTSCTGLDQSEWCANTRVRVVGKKGVDYEVMPFVSDKGIVCVLPLTFKGDSLQIKCFDTCRDINPTSDNQNVLLKIESGDSVTMTICYSQIACMLINTDNNSLMEIEASEDKDVKDKGHVIYCDEKGRTMYSGRFKSLSGHGNLTWQSDKKSYNLKFDSKVDLKCGCGLCSSLCLISNCYDNSYCRNWIAYKFANSVFPQNSVRADFVSLWIDGHYKGLYLMTNKTDAEFMGFKKQEKIDKKKMNRILTIYSDGEYSTDECIKGVDVDEKSDIFQLGYLLELHPKTTGPIEKINSETGFRSNYEMRFGCKYPKYATVRQVKGICKEFDRAYKALLNPSQQYEAFFDTESFVSLYLLQEFFANADCYKSVFIYKPAYDTKIYAGPLWDMDFSMGSGSRGHEHPNCFYVNTPYRSHMRDFKYSGIFAELYSHKEFRDKVKKLYFSQILPLANDIIFGATMDSLKTAIFKDVKYDGLLYDKRDDLWLNDLRDLQSYMHKRVSFLSDIWKNEELFYDVMLDPKFETTYSIMNFPCKKGTKFLPPCFDGKKPMYKGMNVEDGIIVKGNTNIRYEK